MFSEALIVILEHYIKTKSAKTEENDVTKIKVESKENILPRKMNESNNCNETKTSSLINKGGEKENIESQTKTVNIITEIENNSTNNNNSHKLKEKEVIFFIL